MHTFRKAVLVGSMTALVLTALAVPTAAASKGTLGIVNGIPGKRVDICVNGKEIKSHAPYGARKTKIVSSGSKTIKIFKKDPRTCRGTKLAQKTIQLDGGDDFTIVVNKKNPKWVKFDNVELGTIYPVGVAEELMYFALRHAADLGDATFNILSPTPYAPSLDPVWVEGDEIATGGGPLSVLLAIMVTRPDSRLEVLAQQPAIEWKAGHRYEYILLGTRASNAKLILWNRLVTAPAPS